MPHDDDYIIEIEDDTPLGGAGGSAAELDADERAALIDDGSSGDDEGLGVPASKAREKKVFVGVLAVVALIVVALGVRVGLMVISPNQLVGDEAQYWDWSRELQLSYATKGPGVALAIRGATELLEEKFGLYEPVVRAPAVLSWSITMALLAWLAWVSAPGGRKARSSYLAASALIAVPAYGVAGFFMTIDMPYIACWVAAGCAAYLLGEATRKRMMMTAALLGLLLGFILGVGFLLKYTILLLLPGLVLYWLVRWKEGAATLLAVLLMGVGFALIAWPVGLWEVRNDFGATRHLLGHLGLGGSDLAQAAGEVKPKEAYNLMWTLEFIGLQLVIIGPVLALMFWGVLSAYKVRTAEAGRWRAAQLAACTFVPIIVFYLGVTAFTSGEANWPIAGYALLLVPVAHLAALQMPRYEALLTKWYKAPLDGNGQPPKAGYFRRKPETPFQVLWHWAIGFGVVTILVLPLAGFLASAPVIGNNPMAHRIVGSKPMVHRAYAAYTVLRERTGDAPMVIANRYSSTGLLAFYMKDYEVQTHTDGQLGTAYCASYYLGDRRTAYDDMSRTDLTSHALIGRPAVLVGSTRESWMEAFGLGDHEIRTVFTDARNPIHTIDFFPGVPAGFGEGRDEEDDAADELGGDV